MKRKKRNGLLKKMVELPGIISIGYRKLIWRKGLVIIMILAKCNNTTSISIIQFFLLSAMTSCPATHKSSSIAASSYSAVLSSKPMLSVESLLKWVNQNKRLIR